MGLHFKTERKVSIDSVHFAIYNYYYKKTYIWQSLNTKCSL